MYRRCLRSYCSQHITEDRVIFSYRLPRLRMHYCCYGKKSIKFERFHTQFVFYRLEQPNWEFWLSINFGWYQKVKNCCLNNLEGFDFWYFRNFTLKNVKNIQNFKIQSFSNGPNGSFWGFKMTKMDFMLNLSDRKILKFPHCVFPIRLPRSVFKRFHTQLAFYTFH